MKKKAKKNFDYFESLVKMSEFALEEAKYLKEVLATYDPETLEEKKTHMHELEHRCDMEKHDLTTALVKDFLPPIEREDLFNLAHMTDNLTDCVENVMVFLYMADIQKMHGNFSEPQQEDELAVLTGTAPVAMMRGVVPHSSHIRSIMRSTMPA